MADTISTLAAKLRPHWLRDLSSNITAVSAASTPGVTDHGALSGLFDDDHPQYLTPVRGDARYMPAGGGANYQYMGTGSGTTGAWRDVSELAGNGLTAATGVLAVGVANTGAAGLTVEADAIRLTTDSNPLQNARVLATDANGAVTLYNGFYTQGAQSAATFATGFAGSGWRADYGVTTASRASIETDDLTVRGRMRVYELLIQQIRATNGSLLVTSSSKVVTTSSSSNPLWTVNGTQLKFNGSNATLTFTLYTIATAQTAGAGDTDGGSVDRQLYHGFLYGDIIRAQQVRWDGSSFTGVIQSNLEVTSVTNLYTYKAAYVSGDAPAVGYDFVRLGNSSNSARKGVVYLTSDDSAAPFIDIADNISYHSDWNAAGKIKARLGKLTGISDTDFGGALSGYGLYSQNVYLKGAIYATSGQFSGTVYASAGSFTGAVTATSGSFTGSLTSSSGTIGGWTLGASALTAGSGANTVGLDSGGTNPAFYAGSATPGSAPFRVTKTGDLTATSATLSGTIRAASGGVTGNWYVGYDVEYAGYVYAGSGGKIRLGDDGMRLVLPNVTTFDVKVDIPSSSSALRWFSSLGLSWTSSSNYTGQVCYRETTNKFVDWVAMSYVGSTDYATYYARSMLYANRYNGSTNKTCRVEAAVDPGAGGAYVTFDCDTAYTTGAMYVATNMSALSITDRTPHYEGDALAELRQVRGKTRTVKGKAVREIDHDSIPAFARVRVMDTKTNEARDERDLGAMISILTVAVQQLDARLDALEGRGNGRQ